MPFCKRILFLLSFLLPLFGQAQTDIPIVEPVIVDTSVVMEDIPEHPQGYDPTLYSPPPIKPVAMREVSDNKWDEATKNLDYSDDVPQQVKKKELRPGPSFGTDWNNTTAAFGQVLQVLAIVLALAAIGYAIYRTLQSPRNRRIGEAQDGTIITAENVDAYIHETDLERFLREALAAGNYPLGIRLYYLQIIKTLSEKKVIAWSREKTNRDYLRETRDYRLGREFREATRTFERIWYGNTGLDAAGFAALEPGFKDLLKQI